MNLSISRLWRRFLQQLGNLGVGVCVVSNQAQAIVFHALSMMFLKGALDVRDMGLSSCISGLFSLNFSLSVMGTSPIFGHQANAFHWRQAKQCSLEILVLIWVGGFDSAAIVSLDGS